MMQSKSAISSSPVWTEKQTIQIKQLLTRCISADWKSNAKQGLAWIDCRENEDQGKQYVSKLNTTQALTAELRKKKDSNEFVVMCTEINLDDLERYVRSTEAALATPVELPGGGSVKTQVVPRNLSIFSESFIRQHNTGKYLETVVGRSGVSTHRFENISIVDGRGGPK